MAFKIMISIIIIVSFGITGGTIGVVLSKYLGAGKPWLCGGATGVMCVIAIIAINYLLFKKA